MMQKKNNQLTYSHVNGLGIDVRKILPDCSYSWSRKFEEQVNAETFFQLIADRRLRQK